MSGHPLPTSADPRVRPILLAEEPRNRFLRVLPWTVACAMTLALHAGLFWYFTHERTPDGIPPAEEPAAVMIDMAPEVQQAFNQNDQAVGKPMVESAEPPPPPPDEAKPDPTPPVEESPTEAVAPLPPKPPEKPKEKPPENKQPPKPKKPAVKPPSKAAPQTAGGPKSDQRAERTTAASSGAASAASVADWKSQVAAAINRTKRPQSETGIVTLRMSVAMSGAVSGVSVLASSGSAALDAAATTAVNRASPFPPPPPGTNSIFTFRMNFHPR